LPFCTGLCSKGATNDPFCAIVPRCLHGIFPRKPCKRLMGVGEPASTHEREDPICLGCASLNLE
jgi:hypothetical protein